MNPDFSKLDYNDIKQNMIAFLKTQDKFNGYNFEGSTMNILLDILAYNTHYQALYNNIAFNEAFLDTAQKRSSVISIAKNLGYTPSSVKSASCSVEVIKEANELGELPTTGTTSPYFLSKNTKFKVNKDNSVYYFHNLLEAQFVPATLDDTTGLALTYTTGPITLKEGSFKEITYTVDGANPFKKMSLRSSLVDTSTITVTVQKSNIDTSGFTDIWEESTNITSVSGESKVYFLEEGPDESYRIYFGDGVIGKKLSEGNLVTISFLESSGEEANDIGVNDSSESRVFTCPSLGGEVIIAVLTPSFGGTPKETIQSIKYKAPKSFTAQERAVTANDYSVILQKDFAFIKSIKCWGGEDNDPPAYGKVFIAIKPENRAALSQTEKNTVLKSLTRNRAVVGVVPELVDPNIIYLIINCDAKIDIVKNKGSITQLKTKIVNEIEYYIQTNLDVFDADLIANELEQSILAADSSILSVTITPQLEYRLSPVYNVKQDYSINFQNEIIKSESIAKPNIQSSFFEHLDHSNISRTCRIYDDGNGMLYMSFKTENKEYSVGKYQNFDLSVNDPESIGTIDYTTGKLEINDIKPISSVNSIIKFFANIVDSDVFVNPNTILSIDTIDPNAVVINFVESAFRKPIK
jgi:predicted fused transcriptional regulator/phosphomethylpyrimidine kinase